MSSWCNGLENVETIVLLVQDETLAVLSMKNVPALHHHLVLDAPVVFAVTQATIGPPKIKYSLSLPYRDRKVMEDDLTTRTRESYRLEENLVPYLMSRTCYLWGYSKPRNMGRLSCSNKRP